MRGSNAEWDFMGRTFLVLALANMGLREPAEKDLCLEVMDTIIDETLRLERERGLYFFLMPYAQYGTWQSDPPRSLFLDGEIALMLAMRRTVKENPAYRPLLAARVEAIVAGMRGGPVLSAESYPDECWTFCNTLALAAVRMADRLDGTDHGPFLRDWVATARRELTDSRTGLLVSSFRVDGTVLDGPEGSSIWTVSHWLTFVDPEFAAGQYRRARAELGRTALGFGYAREWPASWCGPMDVDSGPVVPILGASPGSSGQAVLAAATFGDDEFLRALFTSLQFAAMPSLRDGGLHYCASNQVGDAVLLYAMLQGPVQRRVMGEGGAP